MICKKLLENVKNFEVIFLVIGYVDFIVNLKNNGMVLLTNNFFKMFVIKRIILEYGIILVYIRVKIDNDVVVFVRSVMIISFM